MNLKIVSLLIGLCALSAAWSQSARKTLLLNATVHVGNGQVIEKGLVGIEGTTIKLVRNALAYTYKKEDWDTIIDLNGQHLYPGFVAPNSTLGLTEIDAVRASRDFYEIGSFNPNVRSLIAYNCESNILSTVRTNGVLMTQATPRGGIISGASAIMQTACWNWEDGVIKADDGIHVNWPASMVGGGWWAEPEPKKRNDKYSEEKREINSFFDQALAYKTGNGQHDLRFDALKDCFGGTKRVYFHAMELQQLLDILDFVSKYEIKNPVIVGGYDAYLIPEKLKAANCAVMLPRLHMLPENDDDAVDLPFRLPFLLQNAGVKFCLQNEGDMEAMHTRNLPFLAGTAMAYGLSEEEALRTITLSSCEIMGIEKLYGSIEEGKRASIFVSKGPALDMRTNQATLILIDGDIIGTVNFQTDLYERYKKKYGL